MAVWVAEKPEAAELPGEDGVRARGVLVRASHVNPTDTLEDLNDDRVPRASGDHELRRMTWWDHKGTTEWVSFRFPRARALSSAEVYWFDDTGRGGCRVPASWRLLYREGNTWKPVTTAGAFGVEKDRYNTLTFSPVDTTGLRVEVTAQPQWSAGIQEWKVR